MNCEPGKIGSPLRVHSFGARSFFNETGADTLGCNPVRIDPLGL